MTTALTLNIEKQVRSAATTVAQAPQQALVLLKQARAEMDALKVTVGNFVEKCSVEIPIEARQIMRRAKSAVNDILNQARSGIHQIDEKTGLSERFHHAAEKAHEIFERVLHRVEALETPVEVVNLGCEFGTYVHKVEEVSHKAGKGVAALAQPLQLITLIDEVKKVAHKTLEMIGEGIERVKAKEIAVLGFSIVSKVCNLLSWVQQLSIFQHAHQASPHAVVHAGRLSMVGSLSYLMMTVVQLMHELTHQTTVLKLVKAILNTTIAAIGVFLIFYVSSKIHFLLLTLTAGTLLFNVFTKEPEHDPAKEHELAVVHA